MKKQIDKLESLFEGKDLLESLLRGGEGSGNHGHAGRPGEVGGSAPAGEGSDEGSSSSSKTPEQTLTHYQDGGFQKVNGFLRDGKVDEKFKNDVEQDIKNLDNMMEETTSRTFLHRGDGAGVSSALCEKVEGLPDNVDYETVMFGKIDGKSYNDFYTEKFKGMEFEDEAFLSTSGSKQVALEKFTSGATKLSKYGAPGLVGIDIPKGTKMIDVEKYSTMGAGEKEYILARGTRMRVNSVSFQPLPTSGGDLRFYMKWDVEVVK